MSEHPSVSPHAPDAYPGDSSTTLRCQWCAKDLPVGVTTCPSCGSIGVPDPRMQASTPESPAPDLAEGQPPLTEWWRDDAPGGYDGSVVRIKITFEEAERRKMQTYIVIGASVGICMLTGWLAGPLLSGVVEHFTGTTVENGSDLRPMGAILGLMIGFFIGATGGWVVWSNKS